MSMTFYKCEYGCDQSHIFLKISVINLSEHHSVSCTQNDFIRVSIA